MCVVRRLTLCNYFQGYLRLRAAYLCPRGYYLAVHALRIHEKRKRTRGPLSRTLPIRCARMGSNEVLPALGEKYAP